jgi:hypothetical protein
MPTRRRFCHRFARRRDGTIVGRSTPHASFSNADVLWLEEPLGKFDYDGLARLCAEPILYIAGGESNRELHSSSC